MESPSSRSTRDLVVVGVDSATNDLSVSKLTKSLSATRGNRFSIWGQEDSREGEDGDSEEEEEDEESKSKNLVEGSRNSDEATRRQRGSRIQWANNLKCRQEG